MKCCCFFFFFIFFSLYLCFFFHLGSFHIFIFKTTDLLFHLFYSTLMCFSRIFLTSIDFFIFCSSIVILLKDQSQCSILCVSQSFIFWVSSYISICFLFLSFLGFVLLLATILWFSRYGCLISLSDKNKSDSRPVLLGSRKWFSFYGVFSF